jgi:hypothetical protein
LTSGIRRSGGGKLNGGRSRLSGRQSPIVEMSAFVRVYGKVVASRCVDPLRMKLRNVAWTVANAKCPDNLGTARRLPMATGC